MNRSREFKNGILPTRLFSTRTNVSKLNDEQLLALNNTIHSFEATTMTIPLGEEYIEYYSEEKNDVNEKKCVDMGWQLC